MVTNGITYGASQLTSDGVSYRKNGETITVKQALDDLINTSLTEIDSLKEHAKVYKYAELYDAVQVGDYVAYDAGDWKESAEKPTKSCEFGGYSANTSKNSSVERCYTYSSNSTTLNGWRVLKKEDRKVYLVHAGQSECYYHSTICNNTSVTKLNERANEYKNEYAESAHAMTKDEAEAIAINNSLRMTGSYYWLANSYNDIYLWYVNYQSYIGYSDNSMGFRPVIVLKPNVLTTGQGQDEFKQKAWILVQP